MENEKKRGGYRPNAGRKPAGKKQITCRIEPEAYENLTSIAAKYGLTNGEVISKILKQRTYL